MRQSVGLVVVAGWMSLGVAGKAEAQESATQNATVIAPESASPPPAPTAAEPQLTCEPACRSGFTCIRGACVSKCNPPCGTSEECTGTGECQKQQPAIRSVDAPPKSAPVAVSPPEAPPGARTHDGVYLRASTGWQSLASGTHERGGSAEAVSDDLSGGGWHLAVMLGGTLGHGFVLGGGLWDIHVGSPTVTRKPTLTDCIDCIAVAARPLNLIVIGPYVAWYPKPNLGWNLDLTIGWGIANFQGASGDTFDYWETSGVGATFGGGYDFWIANEWSLGLQARLSIIQGSAGADKFSGVLPGLAGTVTFH